MRRLRDVGEHAWLAHLLARLARRRPTRDARILVGPGDDAAVVRGAARLVLTSDTLVDQVHFRRGWLTAAALGRRAFAVNASDLAAMGAVPRWALLALEASPRMPVAELDALALAFAGAAERAGARLVGGNVARGPHLALTVALVGEAPGRIVTRAGARAGDAVYVTGVLGASGAARRAGRLPEPPRRTRAGVALARVASAMIDVSDGLVQDLTHVCRASGVGATVEIERLPVAPSCRRALGGRAAAFAVTEGEDYELLVAVPAARERMLRTLAPRLGCRLTRIGRVTRGRPGVTLVDGRGRRVRLARGGFDHFRR
jgi:thiamine-monophosphate kinase